MSTVLVYQCETCKKAWETQKQFKEDGLKRKHPKCIVIKLPRKSWEDLKKKYPEEDEI